MGRWLLHRSTLPEIFDSHAAEVAWHSHRLIYDALAAHHPEKAIEALDFHRTTAQIEVEKAKIFLSQSRQDGAPRQRKRRQGASALVRS